MKNTLKTLAIGTGLAAAMLATPSFAVSPPSQAWYGGISGDLTWMGDSDVGGGGNADLGYRFNNVRLEGEVGYHDASGGGNAEHYWAYMGNLYYDFNNMYSTNGWNVAPYIGGGLGDAEIRGDSEFAWQGMVGLGFTSASQPNATYRLGYRYFGADDNDPHASNIELGANFTF